MGALLWSGCATPTPDPQPAPPASEVGPVDTPPPDGRAIMLEQLLAQGEAALARGHLTHPEHDNAYDKFRAVLLLEPDHAQAQAALHGVLLAYVDRIRTALRRGQLSEAQRLLARGQDAFPDASMLVDMRAELRQVQATRQAEQMADVGDAESEGLRVALPVAELNQRSEAIEALLGELAERVMETRESVMIWARTDAEGRWIYQTMQAKTSDYRIRGDIRISSQPFVQLLEPL